MILLSCYSNVRAYKRTLNLIISKGLPLGIAQEYEGTECVLTTMTKNHHNSLVVLPNDDAHARILLQDKLQE